MASIEDVEGIGPAHAKKLRAAGVATTDALLKAGAKPSGRKDLEASTGIAHSLILEWVNHVDLMRINGVGSEYSDLLEEAGVDSPAELAQRNAASLSAKIQGVMKAQPHIVRRVPSEKELGDWIAQSKKLSKVVEH